MNIFLKYNCNINSTKGDLNEDGLTMLSLKILYSCKGGDSVSVELWPLTGPLSSPHVIYCNIWGGGFYFKIYSLFQRKSSI